MRTHVNLPGGKGGGSKRIALAPTVEVVGDKIMPTEAFAKAQYQLGKEAEKAMNHAFRLGPDPAFERAEERIRGRADTMAFFLGLVCGIFLFTVGALIAGWWK